MAEVTLKGTPFPLKGEIPAPHNKAEDINFVKDDLSEAKFSDLEGNVKVIIAVPSLDTGVCAEETRKFNQSLGKKDKVVGVVVSKDLPFAMKRFCETNGVENIINASDFRYGEFVNKYNTEIADGPFKGLSARAVFVVDQQNNIHYSELVKEIGEEPDYNKVLTTVDELLS